MSTVSVPLETTDAGPLRTDWLRLDRQELREQFDRKPFLIGHALCEHPLLQLPRLIQLATTLPPGSVEYNSGDLQVNQYPQPTPGNGLSPEETLRQVETCGSWMVLKDVQQDPAYAHLLDACLDQIQPLVENSAPGMYHRRAFIFVSSAGATTPYHADFEHNFLLQIRGDKTMRVWDGNDRSVMSELERERLVAGGHRNLPYCDDFAAKCARFHLIPGVGLQVPLTSPHWVKVGSDVSVSLSLTFMTEGGFRTRAAHTTNAFLRKLGLSPREVGRSRIGDALKSMPHRVARMLGGLRRRIGRLAGAQPRPAPPASTGY